MEHRTTVVEFSIQPVNLFAIAEHWANQFGFSSYEKNANHAIYSKGIRLMTAWLSVKNDSECARIEAWLSGPGVGPDFEGNLWRGWKIALPQGQFGFGPQFIFRKEFNALLDLLESKSQNAIREISSQPALNKSIMVKGIASLGIVILVVGALNLFTATSLLLKSTFPDLANTLLISGLFETVIGGLIIASSRALAKGNLMAIWFYGGSILLDGAYNITTSRPMNYLFIVFGLLSIWQMFKFKDEWKLS